MFAVFFREPSALVNFELRPKIESRRILAVNTFEIFAFRYQKMCEDSPGFFRRLVAYRDGRPPVRPIVVGEKVSQSMTFGDIILRKV